MDAFKFNPIQFRILMTMFGDIDNNGFLPSKHKITNGSTNDDGETQPYIVCHEN